MREIRMQLNDLVMSEDYSSDKAGKLIDEKTNLMSQNMKRHIEAKHQIYSALTPEQKKQYREIKDKMITHYKKCKSE